MTFRECVVVVLMGIWLMFAPPRAMACDCAHFAYEALKRINIKLPTVPAIVGTTAARSSYYRGVVSMRIPSPCDVYVHEFAHHDQWLHGKEAKQQYDAVWFALENDAKAIEKHAMEYPPQCLEDDS